MREIIYHYEVSIIPHDNLDKEVLFRFSKQLGIVDADDLGGTPVYMNLKDVYKRQMNASPVD